MPTKTQKIQLPNPAMNSLELFNKESDETMKKILVIDGNSIINRAFFGVRPLTTKSGKNTNAVFGTVNIISRQIEAVKPDYAAVAFDLKAPTFRHQMYSEYKAGRNPTPPELLEQFADAKECLSLMGIHTLELAGYEAELERLQQSK